MFSITDAVAESVAIMVLVENGTLIVPIGLTVTLAVPLGIDF